MKLFVIFLFSIMVGSSSRLPSVDCSEAHSSADDAYSYCKRAYNEDDWDESKRFLKKAMDSFEDAMSAAEDCNCDDAHSSSDDGYSYAKKGYHADNWEDTKNYARKAKSSAEDTMSNADDCN